jgi:large subunit ribosomal protein L6
VDVPAGVEVKFNGQLVSVKGKNGALEHQIHDAVEVVMEEQQIRVKPREGVANSDALAGTTRAVLFNMVHGVHAGWERKLILQGVGYRAKASGKSLNLTLGFSHPVEFSVPEGISIETPSNTEVVVKGANKQLVGEIAAKIRSFRPPEPYKGKGVRYADEVVRRKEAKKK